MGSPCTFLYCDVRLDVIHDDKCYEHLFHNTILKPYQRPNIPIQGLLNPVHPIEVNKDTSVHYTEKVKNEHYPRFKYQREKEYDIIKAKGGAVPFHRIDLPNSPNIIGNRFILVIKYPKTQFECLKTR